MARGRGGGFCVVEMGEVLVFMSGRDELCICGGGGAESRELGPSGRRWTDAGWGEFRETGALAEVVGCWLAGVRLEGCGWWVRFLGGGWFFWVGRELRRDRG